MTSNRVEVAAVVLIDPPPLQAMAMNEGRSRILRRYSEPLISAPAYRFVLDHYYDYVFLVNEFVKIVSNAQSEPISVIHRTQNTDYVPADSWCCITRSFILMIFSIFFD